MLFGLGGLSNELHAFLAFERLQSYLFCHFSMNKLVTMILISLPVKQFKNRLRFDTVTAMSLMSSFLEHNVDVSNLHCFMSYNTSNSNRPTRRMDTAAFCRDILQSKLYDSTTTSADEYAELFDGEVRRVLDIHAPLRRRRRRCGQHDIRQLSVEARQAKRDRRRLERRYRRTGNDDDRRAYRSAGLAARVYIQKSRSDHTRKQPGA